MGQNASRPSAQQQQQQQQQPSPNPNAPTRTLSSSRRSTASASSKRRNSIQPPASAKHIPVPTPTDTAFPLPGRLREEGVTSYSQPRRGSIAEVVSGGSWAGDAVPPRGQDLAVSTPRTPTAVRAHPKSLAGTVMMPMGTGDDVSAPPSATEAQFSPIIGTSSTKRNSMASTLDGEDDIEEVDADSDPVSNEPGIPTLVQWPHGGDRVLVIGSWTHWRKKFRLTRSDNMLAAIIPMPAGTHHIKFIVDSDMRTSDTLPTAVDDTGILVNYIEVNADDMPPLEREPSRTSSPEHPKHSSEHIEENPADINNAAPKKRYTNEIPAYLRAFVEGYGDENNNNPSRSGGGGDGGGGVDGEGKVPPPALPSMLQKIIMNTNSTMKDDASVLDTPNHVVLNHLATSSIKNQVVGVSATTRYKKKYVSTILYKAYELI